MPENKDSLLQHYRHTREGLLSAIEGLSDAQMSDPSIDQWSVKDHLAHIAAWDEIRASEVERISAGYESAWQMSDAQDSVYNDMAYELRVGVSAAQARWELDTSRQRLLDAIAAAPPRGLDASLYGEAALLSKHESQHAEWIKRWRREKGY